MRRIYVISDLHLGGDHPKQGDRSTRGFRLCTRPDTIANFVDTVAEEVKVHGPRELVLNGDTVDFLAERDIDTATWSPFTENQDWAIKKLNNIVKNNKIVFKSLNGFLEGGGRLTIILGNHDVELSLPSVREAFTRALGVKASHDFAFIYDGEAYVVGDALIEHGNRYDAWNQIDLDALRRTRSLLSRRQEVSRERGFMPPAGSEMVTSVINPIKHAYPFIDLLKPETSAAVPILLALEPSYRKQLGRIASLAYRTRHHGLDKPAYPTFGGDTSSASDFCSNDFGREPVFDARSPTEFAPDESLALNRAIKEVLGDEASDFLQDILAVPYRQLVPGSDISFSETIDRAVGFFGLVFGSKSEPIDRRLRALLKAIRGLQNEDTFKTDVETDTEYLESARQLTKGGFRYVVFGHTHKAKHVDLGGGCFYLNSGTWADVLEFPMNILKLPDAEALHHLLAFLSYLKAADFSDWTCFKPTFVQLDLNGQNTIENASLHTFPRKIG